MAEHIDKASVLREMSTSYAALEAILTSLDKVQYFTEGVIQGWSIKDILAHISSWHHRLLKYLEAAVQDEEPPISGPDNLEGMDALNDQFYQENKSLPLDDVLSDFRNTYQQILSIVQTMPEEALLNPQRFSWSQGEPLWKSIAGDTYEHYQEHSEQIQEWLVKYRQA
jgi:hypothetical protein